MAKRKSTSAATHATPSAKRTRSNPSPYSQAVVFDEREIPYIRLRGFWLAAAGFEPADDLKVAVSKGRIVVTRR
ncbi:type I toxin-antitoxin system SymE family toxin [Tahibacter soli]|uniref:Type I toxin-antitoxin system SymE family toxin n=1 Tax=Tahibacter soli TaxID=2983605 RepID=A0A9X3YSA0_9GAMM|nr:type I toxin-antitoxin system SymE family toxin [Tahibacter soli]MDC8015436.1 type I toxin-antitoxin system SymE family toxin [Tahibacter soli]